MPTELKILIKDPEFLKFSNDQKLKLLRDNYPDFAALNPQDQNSFISEISKRIPSKSIGGFISNVGRNVGEVGKGLYQTVRHPFQTAGNIGGLVGTVGRAGMEKLTGEKVDPEAMAAINKLIEPIAKSIAEPSKIPERMFNYAYEKPVDVAMLASPTLGVAGKVAKAGEFPRLAEMLTKASEFVNPVTAASKTISPATKVIKKFGKEATGALTGGGPGFISEAAKGGEAFQKAMRGEMTGEEVVETAKDAIGKLREKKGSDYRARLAQIEKSTKQIDMSPIQKEVRDIMDQEKIRINPETFEVDTSRAGMSKEGRNKISEVINEVWTWEDKTPSGLDRLRKRLDDFYSESSQARAIVTRIRNSVNATITKAVPEYATMTKGYREANNLVKEIESSLSLRKEGMSGRVTADATLKRLTSALKEGSEIRKDLMDTLGVKGAQDVSGAVAGHVASQFIPRGLIGKAGTGWEAYIVYLHPKLWPVLAASSPRVVGEFLNAYGKACKALGTIPATVGKAAKVATSPAGVTPVYLTSKVREKNQEPENLNKMIRDISNRIGMTQ
jgi:hypothetical protein